MCARAYKYKWQRLIACLIVSRLIGRNKVITAANAGECELYCLYIRVDTIRDCRLYLLERSTGKFARNMYETIYGIYILKIDRFISQYSIFLF